MEYRALTEEEILVLENRNCWAEAWNNVHVADGFEPRFLHHVLFYGSVYLGVFDKSIEVSKGFMKHSGINNATLRNVTIGDNCLIENIGNYMNNYRVGNDCYISNVCTIETTEGATYGEGNMISVLNEVGDGNVVLFKDLNSAVANARGTTDFALIVHHRIGYFLGIHDLHIISNRAAFRCIELNLLVYQPSDGILQFFVMAMIYHKRSKLAV